MLQKQRREFVILRGAAALLVAADARLAANLERRICDYIDAVSGEEDCGPIEWPFQFGISLYEEIVETLESSSAARSPLNRLLCGIRPYLHL
jgi:hypothetical protein